MRPTLALNGLRSIYIKNCYNRLFWDLIIVLLYQEIRFKTASNCTFAQTDINQISFQYRQFLQLLTFNFLSWFLSVFSRIRLDDYMVI